MVNIFLCGDLNDTSVSQALISALPQYGGVRYSGPNRVSEYGSSPEYFLYEYEKLPEIGLKRGMVLFKNGFPPQKPLPCPPGFLYVLESKNVNAAALLKGSEATAVTCGTSPKDTLSIAGLEDGTATLSLQRTLNTLDGQVLEPHDFNAKFNTLISPHQLLMVCAALLIAGVDSFKEYNL
ncbi:hypothetical protein CAFE_20340 [Caprobacter fermentans]|uniref:Uncharacterized protein n=1 Tax=Caproicibacter fermentans TaxID=2576756 RepID=A0A6N8HZZ3_9FIRM|nr:hypothetical protein [Caproicibacter fermentans]MVB11322.1 hypothetical protein [Caproicibacter fermentans]OCN00174.1 hypothetical protein A7X67_17975 [Clostridium sp. W14A]QNK41870.1 hypothetical protein HCR03_06440 [Caproicibacter fermentans]